MRNMITTGIVAGAVLSLLVWAPRSVGAHMGEETAGEGQAEQLMESDGHGESVEAVLGEMLAGRDITTLEGLNCGLVGEDEFDRLGDAVMEQQHPGPAHEVMDRMMGGEDSGVLRQMHINMGRAYLGCDGDDSRDMINMMGRDDLLNNYTEDFSMMGLSGGMMAGYGILAGLTWIVLIAFLSTGVYFFLKQASKK